MLSVCASQSTVVLTESVADHYRRVALSLASHLDLLDLFSLGSTCRKVHDSLVQFSHQLRINSLRCSNDTASAPIDSDIDHETVADAFRQALGTGFDPGNVAIHTPALPLPYRPQGTHFQGGRRSYVGLTGKIGQCARDMVGSCRRCGTVVCRNCAVKPPSDKWLTDRFRRLCKTCQEAPLIDHLLPLRYDEECNESISASSGSSTRSTRSSSSGSNNSSVKHGVPDDSESENAFTASAFTRMPCTCDSRGVYLCQWCGHNLRAPDTTYKRVWTWRSRYSTHIGGGLGTGLGLGNQGQKCARGEQCLEKGTGGVCWVEIECSDARAQDQAREDHLVTSRSSTPAGLEYEGDHSMDKPGYLRQEIEGIGGVVKKKVKKRVKTGATVYEYDDERESGKYLEREASGQQRGWCGWCARVSLSHEDKAELTRLLEH